MRADYHIHTSFSDDSTCPMEEMIKKALKLNIDEICFTDHVDYGVKADENCDYDRYFDEYYRLKDKYSKNISLKIGIEFGVQKEYIDKYNKDFEKYNFDFVIMSIHQVDNLEFWTQDYQRGKTQREYNRGHYKEMLEIVKNFNNYSIVGHLDSIKRYDKVGIYPDEEIMDLVEEIFEIVIKNNKGIEVNTSSFLYGLEDLTPSKKILKKYLDMGGKILTIGSDAHESKNLYNKIDDVKEILKEIGFNSFSTFDKLNEIYNEL